MQNTLTSTNSGGILLSRIIRFFAIISAGIFVFSFIYALYLLNNKEEYLRRGARTLVTVISLLPTFGFIFIFIIYENLYPYRRFSKSITFYLFLLLVYTLIPALIIIFRYNAFYESVTAVINVISVVMLIAAPLITIRSIKIFAPLYHILYEAWSPKQLCINPVYFDSESIRDRTREYHNLETLEVFQSSYVEGSIEASVVAKTIRNTEFVSDNSAPISVLDVGGFDGVFTSKLLHGLGMDVEVLDLVEPLNRFQEYKRNLAEITTSINFSEQKFEEFIGEKNKKYNLIIASHSLYAYLDQDDLNIPKAINQLQSYLKSTGLLVVLFGSVNSSAYSFKNEVLELLLNKRNFDTTAEKFLEELKTRNDLVFTKKIIDNYIDTSYLLKEDMRFKKWVSYFARIPLVNDQYMIEQLKNLSIFYSTRFLELPECSKVNQGPLHENTYMMLHKTEAIFINIVQNKS